MKIQLHGHAFQYAAEQMLLTLFPNEKIGVGDNEICLSLFRGKVWITARADLLYQGSRFSAVRRAPTAACETPLQDRSVCQKILKLAFYDAGVAALGREPPWGALTGVRPVKIPAKAMLQGASRKEAAKILCQTYHVDKNRANLALDCAETSLRVQRSLRPDEISLYIGIPFCPSRCIYCSFVSASVKECLPLVEPFVQALLQEIKAVGLLLKQTNRVVRTIYIGGGTPTTLSAAQMDTVLNTLETAIPCTRCSEFTVEAGRPDTITPEKLAVLAKHGVGRISVNPQSMRNSVLEKIGRPHSATDICRALRDVRRAENFAVNMDLIAGLPGDSPEGFLSSLKAVLQLKPENVTVHTLALKKGSQLSLDGSCASLPSPEEVSRMLEDAWKILRKAGFVPYYLYRQKYMSGSFENVGWALPGFESLYNVLMMEELHSVLALGGGGVSKLVWPASGKIERRANPKFPQEYLRDIDKICCGKESLASFFGSVPPEPVSFINTK